MIKRSWQKILNVSLMERNLLKILVIAGLLLSSTSCKKNVYSVKVYGLKSCGKCRILIDDFKDDDNIQLHMIDIDTHIKAYKKDIALYVGLSDNQAPVIMTESFAKAGYSSKDYKVLKDAIISGKKPDLKNYYKRR